MPKIETLLKETIEFPLKEGEDAMVAVMREEEYRGIKAISQSFMKPLADGKSLHHCRTGLKITPSLKTSLNLGSGFDSICEDAFKQLANDEPVLVDATDWTTMKAFQSRIAVRPDEFSGNLKKEVRERKAEWEFLNQRRVQITEKELKTIMEMLKSALTNQKWQEYLTGDWQLCVFWWEDGLPMKGMLDHISYKNGKRIPIDLKTSTDATLDGFTKKAFNLHYDLQVAHYHKGLSEVYGDENIGVFRFLVVENQPPYLSSYFFADDGMYQSGNIKREFAIRQIKEYLNGSETLPEFPKSEESFKLTPPPYIQSKLNEMEML